MLLERRLDNVVYRLGFASDHAEARQLVRHGHFLVNGKRVEHPVVPGARRRHRSRSREESQKITRIVESLGAVDRRGVPQWLELEKEKFKGRVKAHARRAKTSPCRSASS